MTRRSFLTFAGAAVLAGPLAVAAQPKTWVIGVLATVEPEAFWPRLKESLRALGYVEGQNARFETRSASGKPELLEGMAEELVRLNVDLLVVWQTPAAFAAREASATLPIVMASVADPVGTGLVASLERPGGNITGISGTTSELGVKIVELIRDMTPSAKRAGLLINAADPFTRIFVEQVQRGGRACGIAIQPVAVRGVGEYEVAVAAMVGERAEALIVQPSLPSRQAIDLATRNRLLSISPARFFASEGGLMSYAADQSDLYRNVASYIDRILKGARPADLPVLQPTRYELIVNLKTAQALGFVVPPSFLARADVVID